MSRPSLSSPSLFSIVWWASVLGGWTLVVIASIMVFRSPVADGGALAMTATLLVLLELRPLIQGRGHDPQGVVMSTAFMCAMLLMWGLMPAVVVLSFASLLADLRRRKSLHKVLFNVGQYTLSVAAASLVMSAVGRHPSLDRPLAAIHPSDLLWIAGVWVVYYLTNDLLVSAVLAWTDTFWGCLLEDFWHYAAITFSVLALSPLVVLVAQTGWLLMPLLLFPLLLIYRTSQILLEKEHEATHDSLTGLANRTNLLLTLQETLSRTARDGGEFGLMLIDLDHFKEVNDTLGHHVGDQMLMHFADRLRNAVRPTDHVARLGGDEFAVIVDDANSEQVAMVADRILGALLEPVVLDGMLLEIEASIGTAMHPEHAQRADDLLRLADIAMYMAKQSRGGMAVYTAQRDHNSAERLGLLGELRRALDRHDLTLHYQPKVSMVDGSLMGVEALIRWEHAERGFISPDEFIPLAERSGIMPLLTERVVNLALQQMALWQAVGLEVPVAVNISPTDMAGLKLPAMLEAGLTRYEIPAGRLQLEVTERVMTEDSSNLEPVLERLEEIGVTLSLDDFGTGYSSLVRLQAMSVDELKIDRAFVSRLQQGQAAVAIVRAFVDLAHAMDIKAIAEGVETPYEWDLLAQLGCDGAQGWHIARPMPAAEATRWLHQRATLSSDLAAS
ncbi:cyclic Di-GMP phosphodiesterase RmdB [soil metagenome]